jgi:cyanophycinase
MRLRVCPLLSLAFALASIAPAVAQDNVIGLPKPRDVRRPGAVMLVGGGGITNDVWDRFLELAGGPKAKIVIIPSAGYRPMDYNSIDEFRAEIRSRFSAWVRLPSRGRAESVEFLYTDEPKDADSDAFLRPLQEATAVWFSGGAQSRLGYRFVGHPRQTKFQDALRDVVARGGVVGGTSAGMAALPEIMTTSQTWEWSTGPAKAVTSHGLGVFGGAIVDQHFDGRAGRLERFTGLLKDTEQLDKLAGRPAATSMIGLAVDEGTGLCVRGDRLEALGLSNVEVFIRSPLDGSLTWHTLKTGEHADLRRSAGGLAILLR